MKRRGKTIETVIRRDVRYDGENHYEYELIAAESDGSVGMRLTLYSICTRMTDKDESVSEARINEAFADAGQAILFYDKVVRNLATPIDLRYVLEDERV